MFMVDFNSIKIPENIAIVAVLTILDDFDYFHREIPIQELDLD